MSLWQKEKHYLGLYLLDGPFDGLFSISETVSAVDLPVTFPILSEIIFENCIQSQVILESFEMNPRSVLGTLLISRHQHNFLENPKPG